MKTKMILASIIATAMVLSIAFSGVALASQTAFSVIVYDGTLRAQTSLRSYTEGDVLPYDETGYNLRLNTMHGNSELTHMLNTDTGVDAQTHLRYIPANGLKRARIEEDVKTARVAGGDNSTICCDSSAQTRFLTSEVGYESAVFSEDNDLLLVMNAMGYGRGMIETEENKQIGNESSTWQNTQTKDRLAVSGSWNISAEFVSKGCLYPAIGAEKKHGLCRFNRP